jgi:hypothetical protein
MSSFTSNFRSEGRVLVTVAVVLAIGEAVLRLGGQRLSADVQHIRSIPARADRLAHADGLRILFLGNSLTREGVRLDVVQEHFDCTPPVALERVFPDDTTILDWYYLFRNDFGGERAPKVLVLSYARGQLTDATGIHAERIAGSFGGWSNAREMLRLDLDDLGDRIDYLLASTFRLFSERERVRDRVLATATPDYRSTAQRLNDSERAGRASGTARPAEAFSRLRRLLELCRDRRVRVVVVAMPVPGGYGIDPRLPGLLRDGGADFLDMRSTEGLNASDYADGYHLAPRGAETYSAALATHLRAVVGCRPEWNPGPLGPVLQVSPHASS